MLIIMLELITTPLAVIASILGIGFIIETFDKGFDNVSLWHQAIGIICVIIVLVIILT